MKIAMFFPRSGGVSGADTYAAALLQHWAEDLSNEVHFITDECSKGAAEELAHVTYHYLPCIRSTAIDVRKAFPYVRSLIDSIKPDIIHFHDFMQYFLYTSVFENGEHKTVMTIHSTPGGEGELYKLFDWIKGLDNQKKFLQLILHHVQPAALVTGSQYYKDEYTREVPQLKEYPFYVNRYFSSLPGISTGERLKIDKEHFSSNVHYVLFPSRPVYRKGIEEALRAFACLPDSYRLLVPALWALRTDAMNAQYRIKLDDMIEQLGIKDRVEFPDKIVSCAEMAGYYMRADCVLIPSHFEGFGIVGVEALDYCCPVVSTFSGGLGEIFEDRISGVRVGIKDSPQDIASAIRETVEDSNLRRRLIFEGKNRVKQRFTLERHMDMMDYIYKTILNNCDNHFTDIGGTEK